MEKLLKVSTLISADGKWRENRVNELFPPADATRILDTPIGRVADRNIWAYTDHGAYTVKSGYWFLSNHPLIPQAPLTQREQYMAGLKQRIWKIQTEPKIRFFLWRAISGAMAVAERLSSRGLNIDTCCKLCQQDAETINHVLFRCSSAQQILSAAHIPPPTNGYASDFDENMTYLFDLMESQGLAVIIRNQIPWVLWCIWKHRNTILYAEKQETITIVMQRIADDAKAWRDANAKENEIGNNETVFCRYDNLWLAPSSPLIKCNVSVNWRNANVLGGAAWIARDASSNVIFHARDALTRSPSRTIGELRGIIWALQSTCDLRIKKVVIATDCKAVFTAISKPVEWPRFLVFTEQIQILSRSFDKCVFHLETLNIARELSKSVTRDGRFQSYLSIGGPAWLHDRIQRDARGSI